MNMSSSSVNKGSMKSAVGGDSGGADNQFPAGLRVLVVDDDPTCLAILERMLRSCLYDVTKCNRAEIALSLLRGNKNGFDIVISDVHMPDMDGFKLLECIGLEMDLPVIMMSADDGKAVVMKGVTHGACDYLIKPVRMEALKNIWQHVVRKRKHEWKDLEQSGSVEDGDRQAKPAEDADYSSSANEGNWRNSKKRKDEDEEADDRDDTSSLKKPRVVWSVELHQQFVAAVNQLGIDKAVPKKILELMNVPGLTRENVASHLQKYRLYLRRISGVSHQGGLSNPFMGAQDGSFGPISSFNGLDLQAIASSGQIPAQSLATLQAAALGRGNTRSGIAMPVGDQRIFSFENPKLCFGEGHQQQQLSATNNKQMNLLHGIPTTMEAKQLASLQHPAHSFGNVNMPVNSPGSHGNSLLMHMSQPQSRGQLPNDSTGSNASRLTSSGQPIISNGVVGGVIQARNGIMEDGRGTGYNPISQASSAINFPINNSEVSVNGFPLGSTPGLSNLASKRTFHEEANNSEIKGSRSYAPSYDIFNEFQHQKSQDWELRSGGLNFDASQHAGSLHGSMDVLPSVIVQQQGFPSSQKIGQNAFMIGRTLYSSGEGSQLGNPQIMGQNVNSRYLDNSLKVKAESLHDVTCDNSLLADHYGQEDLMSALLKPQQEGNNDIVGEFDYDGYPMGNISV